MNVGVFVRFENGNDFGYFPGSRYNVGVNDPIVRCFMWIGAMLSGPVALDGFAFFMAEST